MRNMLMVALLLVGCDKGKKDDCERLADKLLPVVAETEKGKQHPMTAEDKKEFLDGCRKDDKIKNDPMMKCVLDASGKDAVKACMTKALGDLGKESKATEATLQLNKIAKNSKSYFIENAAFVKGTSKTLPEKACCPKCEVTQAWTQDPVWSALDFQIDEPNLYQYTYTGKDDTHATVTAVGDLDCDGTMITYTLELSAQDGNPQAKITAPPPNSD